MSKHVYMGLKLFLNMSSIIPAIMNFFKKALSPKRFVFTKGYISVVKGKTPIHDLAGSWFL